MTKHFFITCINIISLYSLDGSSAAAAAVAITAAAAAAARCPLSACPRRRIIGKDCYNFLPQIIEITSLYSVFLSDIWKFD